MKRRPQSKALLRLIDQCLREGNAIEIDGLGMFKLGEADQVVFEPNGRPQVFLAYAEEDRSLVRRLFADLQNAGFEPWMDQERLLPGQNWQRAIDQAIDLSEFFIGCFSSHSTAKRGYFQAELEYALGVASRVPAEEIFLIPARFDDCEMPRQITRKVQYVDLFPDWDRGVEMLIRAMRYQMRERKKKRR